MEHQTYDALKLENQLCFPLYVCSKEIVRRYKPFLDALDLTYTQYITMMVLWEHKSITVKDLGGKLFLRAGKPDTTEPAGISLVTPVRPASVEPSPILT